MRISILLLCCGAPLFSAETRTFHNAQNGLPSNDIRDVFPDASGAIVAVTATSQSITFRDGKWIPAARPAAPNRKTVQSSSGAATAEIRPAGLFLNGRGPISPADGSRSWALTEIRAITFDSRNRLWFASPQGVGVLETNSGTWKLYTGAEGLPYDDFTCIAAGEDGVVWFGTRIGAIRFDGKTWEYRQGPRWLPHDEVRAIAVNPRDGTAWIATPAGLAQIERKPMTLAEKARYFEAEIDKRHRRTPYEYVHPVILNKPGDIAAGWNQTDSDNDGLWTAMYGAGQCYAFAATGDPKAAERAKKAFEALRFLRIVTEGGAHPPPRGFVARSILPVSGHDPNVGDSPEQDKKRQLRDRRWKVIVPRWPKSADGQWYWKSDTSSDELDGHFFFYGLYYDLVAKSDTERARVREHVAAIADHLIAHDFSLIDHDGKPTRWGVFGPSELNHNRDWWQERGMNSLSILAYLKVAEHIVGDKRYADAAHPLIRDHGYATNTMIVKTHLGAGAGNQSDDEMIFMNFYSLLRYEKDPDLRQKYLMGFHNHWQNEWPELNPVFHFLYAAVAKDARFNEAYGDLDLSPPQVGDWLRDSLDTLQRIPLDRIDWPIKNSHRKDIAPLTEPLRDPRSGSGRRVNGKVLPADERYIGHWNHDPWRLDNNSGARTLGDGGVFLLPYYMGLYHGFVRE
jgi:hypothetical protein